jgi:putative flavoprotein involved in K+ transport
MNGNVEKVETVIIGGGHAGLTMSYFLSQLGREHVILERARVANGGIPSASNFPTGRSSYPVNKYQCDDPNAFVPGHEVEQFLDG